MRAYRREMRALEPAEAPLPLRQVAGLLVIEASLAELGFYAERRWRRWRMDLALMPAFFATAWPLGAFRNRAGQEAARRRGVVRVGDGPPEPPRAPIVITSVGAALGLVVMRRRGVRWARGGGAATALQAAIVREWEIRRRWRIWKSGGRFRS